MLFFGVCFFLYFIKLSAGNGFFFVEKSIMNYSSSGWNRTNAFAMPVQCADH